MLFTFSAVLWIAAPEMVPRKTRAACLSAEQTNPDILHDAVVRFGRALGQKPAEAVRELERLATDYPWFALAHRAIAEMEMQRDGFVAAYAAYKRYVLFEIDDRDEIDAALRDLETKQSAIAAYAKAEMAAHGGAWKDVLRELEPVIEQKPQFAMAHRLRGIAYAALGEKSGSAKAYAQYLSLEPLAVDRDEVRAILTTIQ